MEERKVRDFWLQREMRSSWRSLMQEALDADSVGEAFDESPLRATSGSATGQRQPPLVTISAIGRFGLAIALLTRHAYSSPPLARQINWELE